MTKEEFAKLEIGDEFYFFGKLHKIVNFKSTRGSCVENLVILKKGTFDFAAALELDSIGIEFKDDIGFLCFAERAIIGSNEFR